MAPRVALVTGCGNRRVGWYVARALGTHGYALAVHARRPGAQLEDAYRSLAAEGYPVLGVAAELGDEVQVRDMVRQVVVHYGRLDVLVNCAAVWERKPLEEVTAADVRRHFEANVLGTFLCSQQAGLVMVGRPEGGCIITVGDWAVARPYKDYAAYFPSKGAIPALTSSLAVELAARNPKVRVNGILPGPVLFQADADEATREAASRQTLLKHPGSPESVAAAVLSLVENDFITGVCLPVDGGRTIYAPGE
jgi:pteridine reductase